MTIGEIRKEHGLTQQQIADKLNIKQSTVAMWETGKSSPSFKTLIALSEVLGVSVDTLCQSLPKGREGT